MRFISEVIRDILSDSNIKYTSSQTIIGCLLTHPSPRLSCVQLESTNLVFPSLHSSQVGHTSRDRFSGVNQLWQLISGVSRRC